MTNQNPNSELLRPDLLETPALHANVEATKEFFAYMNSTEISNDRKTLMRKIAPSIRADSSALELANDFFENSVELLADRGFDVSKLDELRDHDPVARARIVGGLAGRIAFAGAQAEVEIQLLATTETTEAASKEE